MPVSAHRLPQPLPVPAGGKPGLGKTFTGSMLSFAKQLAAVAFLGCGALTAPKGKGGTRQKRSLPS